MTKNGHVLTKKPLHSAIEIRTNDAGSAFLYDECAERGRLIPRIDGERTAHGGEIDELLKALPLPEFNLLSRR